MRLWYHVPDTLHKGAKRASVFQEHLLQCGDHFTHQDDRVLCKLLAWLPPYLNVDQVLLGRIDHECPEVLVKNVRAVMRPDWTLSWQLSVPC